MTAAVIDGASIMPQVAAPAVGSEDAAVQLRRRRADAQRCEPLPTGDADPWRYQTWPSTVQAARAAWAHLTAVGLMSDHVAGLLHASTHEAA